MVDGILERLREEQGPARVIATGGLADAVVPYCASIDEVDDLLTLTGLRLIWSGTASSQTLGQLRHVGEHVRAGRPQVLRRLRPA